MDNNEIVHNRHSLKHKLMAAVANNDDEAARELRFLLRMEKKDALKGSKKNG